MNSLLINIKQLTMWFHLLMQVKVEDVHKLALDIFSKKRAVSVIAPEEVLQA